MIAIIRKLKNRQIFNREPIGLIPHFARTLTSPNCAQTIPTELYSHNCPLWECIIRYVEALGVAEGGRDGRTDGRKKRGSPKSISSWNASLAACRTVRGFIWVSAEFLFITAHVRMSREEIRSDNWKTIVIPVLTVFNYSARSYSGINSKVYPHTHVQQPDLGNLHLAPARGVHAEKTQLTLEEHKCSM